MDIQRRLRILASQKSPSIEALKRTYTRAVNTGGVTVDFSANVDNIRDISRKLYHDVLSDAVFTYVPSSYAESKTYSQDPNLLNLLNYSEEFNNSTYWSIGADITISSDVIISPIGTLTADKLKETAINSAHRLIKVFSTSSDIGFYTASIYVKPAERTNFVLLMSDDTGGDVYIQCNLSASTSIVTTIGSSWTNTSGTLTSIGDGWFRVTITSNKIAGTNLTIRYYILASTSFVGYLGDGVSGLYIWGAQLTKGQNLPTFTTQKPNLLSAETEFNNSVWLKQNSFITANTATAPDGNLSADNLIENNTSNIHITQQSISGSVIGYYTSSCYFKKYSGGITERRYAGLSIDSYSLANNNNSRYLAIIDLQTGLITNTKLTTAIGVPVSNPSNSVIDYGNYWQLTVICQNNISGETVFSDISISLSGTPVYSSTGLPTYQGDGVSGISIWGGKLYYGSGSTLNYQRTTDGIVDLNFTRATSSTLINKNGIIEDSCYNLTIGSESMSNYNPSSDISKVSVSAINPIGGATVLKIVEGTANTVHYISYVPQSSVTVGTQYNFSIYAKSSGRDNIILFTYDGINASTLTSVNFNVSNGTVTTVGSSVISSNISLESNGYYRCSMVVTTPANATTQPRPGIMIMNGSGNQTAYLGDGISGLYIWGSQLTQGSSLKPYLKTTNGLNVPKLDYNNDINTIRKNLLNYSEDYSNSIWSKLNSTILSNVTLAPNITNTASKLVASSTNTTHYINQFFGNNNDICTYSVYVKAAEKNWCVIQLGTNYAFYNVSLGTVGTITGAISASINDVGNGWYRCILFSSRGSSSPTNNAIYVSNGDGLGNLTYSGDGVSGIYIWGAQIEFNSTATYYQKITDISINSINKPSLLIEPQRTNLVLWSEDFSNAVWIANSVTISKVIGAMNTNTGIKLTESNINEAHRIYQSVSTSINTVYTNSVYVKKTNGLLNERRYISLVTSTVGTGGNYTRFFVIVDTQTGVVTSTNTINIGTGGGLVISNYGVVNSGNWYRISTTFQYTIASTTSLTMIELSDSGTPSYEVIGGNVVYQGNGVGFGTISSPQIEQGTNATTYIPTTTATVTRNGEYCYVDLFNNNILNQNNFTLYVEGYSYDSSTNTTSISISNNIGGFGTNTVGFYNGINNILRNNGSTSVPGGTHVLVNSNYRWLVNFDNGTAKWFRNGVLIFTTTGITATDYRYLVVQDGGSTYTTDKIALFNRTLTDLECLNLTSPTYNSFEALASAYTYTLIT